MENLQSQMMPMRRPHPEMTPGDSAHVERELTKPELKLEVNSLTAMKRNRKNLRRANRIYSEVPLGVPLRRLQQNVHRLIPHLIQCRNVRRQSRIRKTLPTTRYAPSSIWLRLLDTWHHVQSSEMPLWAHLECDIDPRKVATKYWARMLLRPK